MPDYISKVNIINGHLQNKEYDIVITKGTKLFIDYPEQTMCLEILINTYKTIYNVTNNTEQMINAIISLTHHLPSNHISPKYIPPYCILHNELAIIYANSNKYTEAINCLKKIIAVRNDIPDIYNNMATCHISLKEYHKAIICSKISLNLGKTDNTYRTLADTNLYIKKYKDSIINYESIKQPTTIDLYNTSFPYLASKQYLKGFELYENRLADNKIHQQTNQITRVEIPSLPYWNGKDPCNHLMIIYEQGIGDNIQYFRFIIELSYRHPELKITYFCKDIISHLFNVDSYENITVIDDSSPTNITLYDKKIYIMSLPHILRLETVTLNPNNYIIRDKTNDDIWFNKMTPFNNKLKVGFMYSGLLFSYIDKQIELKDFQPICCDENIQTICLHKMDDKIRGDFSKIDFASEIFVDEIDTDKAFMDTISILRNIDVLVTIDTSIAHLAGVMGIKTLLLIGYTSEWRWFDNDDKVWYESVDIIRMTEQKPLADLIPRVKKLLDAEYVNKRNVE